MGVMKLAMILPCRWVRDSKNLKGRRETLKRRNSLDSAMQMDYFARIHKSIFVHWYRTAASRSHGLTVECARCLTVAEYAALKNLADSECEDAFQGDPIWIVRRQLATYYGWAEFMNCGAPTETDGFRLNRGPSRVNCNAGSLISTRSTRPSHFYSQQSPQIYIVVCMCGKTPSVTQCQHKSSPGIWSRVILMQRGM